MTAADDALRRVRYVWDLTLDQTEDLHRRLHMNNYVYAALRTVRTSQWPRRGRWHIRSGVLPRHQEAFANNVFRFVEQVAGPADPKASRLALTRSLVELYCTFRKVSPGRVPELMQVLASMAFLPLEIERQDELPLWWPPPIRPVAPEQKTEFARMLEPFSLDQAMGWAEEEMLARGAKRGNPLSMLFSVTIRLVSTIIVMIENGVFPELAWQAFQNVETAMLSFEHYHELGGEAEQALGVKRHSQIRYRNTLYLYGGNLLERMGETEAACDWYLRDILAADLPDHLGFYLTSLKTCERLLCGYRVMAQEQRAPLGELINRVVARCLERTSEYGLNLMDVLANHPELDLSRSKIQLGKRNLFFGGESTREPLLVALLYRKVLDGVAYDDTDYSMWLPFDPSSK